MKEAGGQTSIANQERFKVISTPAKGAPSSRSQQLSAIDNKHPRRVMDKVAQLETIILTMGKRVEHLEDDKREDHQTQLKMLELLQTQAQQNANQRVVQLEEKKQEAATVEKVNSTTVETKKAVKKTAVKSEASGKKQAHASKSTAAKKEQKKVSPIKAKTQEKHKEIKKKKETENKAAKKEEKPTGEADIDLSAEDAALLKELDFVQLGSQVETENFITDAFSALKDKIYSLTSTKSSKQAES